MKRAVTALFIVCLAASAWAADVNPLYQIIDHPLNVLHQRDGYCQDPADNFGIILNASAEAVSEVADDLPESFECNQVAGWSFLVGGWGAAWEDPYGLKISFYNSANPPGYGPDQEALYVWNGPFMQATMVYDGDYQVWQVDIWGQDQTHVENPMSIGIQVEDDMDGEPPFYGVVLTNAGNIAQAEGFFSGDQFGYPRWTPMSAIDELGNEPYDMAWCMTTEQQQGCFLNCPADDGGLINPAGMGDKSPDIDFSGAVNVVDFAMFAGRYGTNDYCADFDCSGWVNLVDFALFAQHFGCAGDHPGHCN